MANELGNGKSICVLAIVVACFAILWPTIFYPMLKGALFPESSIDPSECCDVLLDKDVNAVKLTSELCSNALKTLDINVTRGLDTLSTCRKVVYDTCGVDISLLIKKEIQLGHNYKKVLGDIRTVNKSLCLKYHFGTTFDVLGVPHRIKMDNFSSISIRQEREAFPRGSGIHPALRERGRAMPESFSIPREGVPPPNMIKPPIPGMRPPLGGAGHIVPQPKGCGIVGILMPLYTVAIVFFFGYTVLKLTCKKQENVNELPADEEFRRTVFDVNNYQNETKNQMPRVTPKIVVSAFSNLLQEVNREIREREPNLTVGNVEPEDIITKEDEKKTVRVVGVEMTECCENGKRWSRPDTPIITTDVVETTTNCSDSILLVGNVPNDSQILVADNVTESVPSESSIILESKVTLSVIPKITETNGNDEHDEENGEGDDQDEEGDDRDEENGENDDKNDDKSYVNKNGIIENGKKTPDDKIDKVGYKEQHTANDEVQNAVTDGFINLQKGTTPMEREIEGNLFDENEEESEEEISEPFANETDEEFEEENGDICHTNDDMQTEL